MVRKAIAAANPKKIGIPPSLGIGFLWIFRSFGLSTNPRDNANLMIIGVVIIVIINEIKKVKINTTIMGIYYIRLVKRKKGTPLFDNFSQLLYNYHMIRNAIKLFGIWCLLFVISSATALAIGGKTKMSDKMYAVFKTSKGDITCVLYQKQAPITVDNFVGLATGTKEWKDPKSGKPSKTPLYSGTIFHRVIPKFMIQGGDPLGMGIGGPGYKFNDEIDPSLDFSKTGVLAMANAGPNTNGSQFFITVAPTPWLNGHHTIFGQVIKGQEVVDAISNVDRDSNDKPDEPVVIKEILVKTKL